jgi:hypothetical protein
MKPFKKFSDWRFKNTLLLFASIGVFFLFLNTPFVRSIIAGIGDLGYLGAFLTGIFFVSTFTVAPSMVVLYHLATLLNPWEVALLAGLGAVIGDYLIFRFFKDAVFAEIEPHFMFFRKPFFDRIISTPYFAWLVPFVGAIIIASPLPDELGLGMMGLSKIKNWQVILLSFALNSAGIFALITFSEAVN